MYVCIGVKSEMDEINLEGRIFCCWIAEREREKEGEKEGEGEGKERHEWQEGDD